jgi:hypothetical protein
MEVVWLVDFHPPAAAIPLDEFHHGFQGFGGPVGQQAPLNRRRAGRRVFFPRQDRGHGHGGLAVMGRQGHHVPVQRLPHPPRRPVRRGGQGELDLPQGVAPRDPIPQLLPGGRVALDKTEDGKIVFPYDAIHVDFVVKAA